MSLRNTPASIANCLSRKFTSIASILPSSSSLGYGGDITFRSLLNLVRITSCSRAGIYGDAATYTAEIFGPASPSARSIKTTYFSTGIQNTAPRPFLWRFLTHTSVSFPLVAEFFGMSNMDYSQILHFPEYIDSNIKYIWLPTPPNMEKLTTSF